MNRLRVWLVLTIVVVGLMSVLPANGMPARAAQNDPGFSSSATVLSQTGIIGIYEVSESQDYPGAICQNKLDGSQVYVAGIGVIKVQRKQYTTQTFGLQKFLMQRLANGSYSTLYSSNVQYTTTTNGEMTALLTPTLALDRPLGPDYVVAFKISWFRGTTIDNNPLGTLTMLYSINRVYIGDSLNYQYLTVCKSLFPPTVQPSATSGTVNSTFNYTIKRFPLNVTTSIYWDGGTIGTVKTNSTGTATSSFAIPASPIGPHTIKWKYGKWEVTQTFTVKPRIKLIPSVVARDQTVNVSLRGFKKQEVVRVRWKKGDSWIQLAQVTTSNTGSANVNIVVPKWAPNGTAIVRGDSVNASGGHAQTSQVSVNGGPYVPSQAATPTPTQTATPVATSTPTAEVTESPEATPTMPIEATPETPVIETPIEESPSPEVTESPIVETPVPTETASPEAIETAPAEPTAMPEESETPSGP